MHPKFKSLLALFHLKDIEIELFERIFYSGVVSASELARQENITRTSVYDYVARLKEKGLIAQTLRSGIRMYSSESPEKIEILLMEHEANLTAARKALIILEKENKKDDTILRPGLRLFEGRKGLQQMMKDMLLYQKITVRVYWPILDIIKLLTPEFLEKFHKERVQRNIALKTIWPHDQVPSLEQYAFLKIGDENKREVRLAPKGVNFSLGYTIYKDTVRFISSSRESFGFLITSRELEKTMEGQFDIIWANSKRFSF